MTRSTPVRWFSELGVNDAPVAGGKGANLGELTRAGLPVFVVTAQAYLETMDHHGQRKYLAQSIERVPVDDPVALGVLADSPTKVVRASPLLPETVEGILRAYRRLGRGGVAVRSSSWCSAWSTPTAPE
jgi:pyruvate, water dikinase